MAVGSLFVLGIVSKVAPPLTNVGARQRVLAELLARFGKHGFIFNLPLETRGCNVVSTRPFRRDACVAAEGFIAFWIKLKTRNAVVHLATVGTGMRHFHMAWAAVLPARHRARMSAFANGIALRTQPFTLCRAPTMLVRFSMTLSRAVVAALQRGGAHQLATGGSPFLNSGEGDGRFFVGRTATWEPVKDGTLLFKLVEKVPPDEIRISVAAVVALCLLERIKAADNEHPTTGSRQGDTSAILTPQKATFKALGAAANKTEDNKIVLFSLIVIDGADSNPGRLP